MFFTGTLQEGISKALQETKLVVCFVTDNEEESKTWEDEYLKDDAIAPSLDKDAVLLRLEAGSQEAGYLAALVPLPKNPTLVVIKNGELKEYISSGTSREQFVRRVGGAFQAQAQAQAAGQDHEGTTTAAGASTEVSSSSISQTPGQVAPASSSTPPSAGQQQPPVTSRAAPTQSTGAREQAGRKEREEADKRRREKGKMKEAEEEEQAQDPEKTKQADTKKKAAQQLAERQRQAREERARVLRRIEDDKAERRARDEARRAERRRAPPGGDAEALTAAAGEPAPSSAMRARPQPRDQCAVQVRLLDGSTIRTRLPATATLAADVRAWVDGARGGDGGGPYTFKVILTPLPNRAVDPAAEEGMTLAELGLAPSSTLVLVPVDRSSPAYPRVSAGLNNPLSRLIAAVLAYVGGILGGILGAFRGSGNGRRGVGSEGDGQASGEQLKDRAQGQATGRDGAGSSRINGFQNPDDRQRDYQLYNGNSVSH